MKESFSDRIFKKSVIHLSKSTEGTTSTVNSNVTLDDNDMSMQVAYVPLWCGMLTVEVNVPVWGQG